MYYPLASWLSPLTTPLVLACLGLVVALALSWRRPWISRLFLLLVILLLTGLGNGALSGRLIRPLEKAYPIPSETVRAEAAVVLAGTVDLDRSTSERVELFDRPERILEGARLVKEGRADWLVLSGGPGGPTQSDVAEADFLAVLAQHMGVAPERMLLQRSSRTTHEDAVNTAKILNERGVNTFFLVTSAFHMPRAVGCFRKVGLDPIPFPVDFRSTRPVRDRTRRAQCFPTVTSLHVSSLALHEYVGYVVYRVLGYL